MHNVKDMLGNKVAINTWIAVSFKESTSSAMRVGRVIGFGRRKYLDQEIDTMAVEWHASTGSLLPSRPTSIDAHSAKFVVINSPV